jgi:hypothetical protein
MQASAKDLRIELRESVAELRTEMRSSFDEVQGSIKELRVSDEELRVTVQEILVEVRRTRMIVEEEKNRNNIVIDGYHSLYDRQERVESKIAEFGLTLESMAKKSN